MTEPPLYRSSAGFDYRRIPVKNNSCQQYPVTCAFFGMTLTEGYVCTERGIHGRSPCFDQPVIFILQEDYLKHRLMGEI